MTDLERQELEELRRYKSMHEGKALNRAFARLEELLYMQYHDPIMSRRSFIVMAEALVALKDEFLYEKNKSM